MQIKVIIRITMNLSLNLINKKALIIFDNVLWHGDVHLKRPLQINKPI